MTMVSCYSVNYKSCNPLVLNYLFALKDEIITNTLRCRSFSYYNNKEQFRGRIYLTIDIVDYFDFSWFDLIQQYIPTNKEELISYDNLLELLKDIHYNIEICELINLMLINWDANEIS